MRDGNAVIVAPLADDLGGTYRGCLGLGLAFDQGLEKPVEASGDDLPALAKALELARALDAANIADEIVLRNEFDSRAPFARVASCIWSAGNRCRREPPGLRSCS